MKPIMRLSFTFVLKLMLLVVGLAHAVRAQTVGIGVVDTTEEVLFDLTYTNATKAPRVLREVISHCACVTVLDHPERIVAGATVNIPCVYRAEKPGRIAIRLDLLAEGQGAELLATMTVVGVVAEKSWRVTVEELATPDLEGAVLVDTRAPEAFATVRAARSIPMTVASLNRRTDLHGRRLVLMDEGYDPVELLAAVAELRAVGFQDIRVLDGGIAAWLRAGRPVDGVSASSVAAATLGATQFARAQTQSPWEMLHLHAAATTAVPVTHTHAGRIVTVANLEQAKAQLTAADRRWLVMSADTNDYARLERELPAAARGNVYYLAGGPEVWTSLMRQRRSLADGSRELRQNRSATAFPTGGGCGSCP